MDWFALVIFVVVMLFLFVFGLCKPFGEDWENPDRKKKEVKGQASVPSRSPRKVCIMCGRPSPFLCPRCQYIQDGKDNGR